MGFTAYCRFSFIMTSFLVRCFDLFNQWALSTVVLNVIYPLMTLRLYLQSWHLPWSSAYIFTWQSMSNRHLKPKMSKTEHSSIDWSPCPALEGSPISAKDSIIHFVAQNQTSKGYSWFFSFPQQFPHPAPPQVLVTPPSCSPLIWPLLTASTTHSLVPDSCLFFSRTFVKSIKTGLPVSLLTLYGLLSTQWPERDLSENIKPLLKSLLWILFPSLLGLHFGGSSSSWVLPC